MLVALTFLVGQLARLLAQGEYLTERHGVNEGQVPVHEPVQPIAFGQHLIALDDVEHPAPGELELGQGLLRKVGAVSQ